MPARWLAVQSVTRATSNGAAKAVTLPENANKPKYCAALPGGESRAMSDRLAD